MQADDSWIKISDFEETAIWIQGKNVTTGIALGKLGSITLGELSHQGLTMRVPASSCAEGHQLMLTILKGSRLANVPTHPDPEKCLVIEVTAKVMGLEMIDASQKLATIQFYQFDQVLWKKFLSDLEMRQKRVQQVFNRIKGIEI